MRAGVPMPWWQTSLWITLSVVALVAAAIWAPWPFNLLAVIAAAVYLFLALRNPEMWLRWLARGCIAFATTSAAMPEIAAAQHWEGGFIKIFQSGTPTYVFLFTGAALAALDVWREHLGRQGAKPTPDDDDPEPLPLRDDPKDPLEDDIHAYFKAAISRHRNIQLAGFETKVRVPIRLEDLYVPLNAMFDANARGDAKAFSNAKDAAEHVDRTGMHRELLLSDAFTRAKELGDRNGVVLLGDPGSGKTTHLKRILLKIANEGAESLGLREGTVPVFLPLRELLELDQGLDAFIERVLSGPNRSTPEGFGARLRKRGRVLYLLDGLDEVRDVQTRAKVARWIDDARTECHDSYFLVTCRYAGYTDNARLHAEFLELHLRPLGDEQVDQFVRRWFSIVETSLVGEGERGEAKRLARERADLLMKELRLPQFQSARVYELTHNPLLLTTICLVHRDDRRLPHRRVDLYSQCVNVLLERWNQAKDLEIRFPAREARKVLQPVAGWMHQEQGRTRASAKELEEPVSQGLAVIERKSVEAADFLRTIRDESGLLTGWGTDEFGFMHLGFQEYLVAQDLRTQVFEKPERLGWLAQHFDDSWWQEVILLLLAGDDPPMFKRFMAEVMKQPRFSEWAGSQMMDLCLADAFGDKEAPFLEVLRHRGDDAGLVARQVTAAKVLMRARVEELAGLEELLRAHPATEVRSLWNAWKVREAVAGDVIWSPRGEVELVRIPGGSFLMGSPESEEGRYGNESPRHRVELSSFFLARRPVTNAQYAEYLKANPDAKKPEEWGNRQYNQPDQPVVGVSWYEAKAYCDWAGLVLPTEAQWEYACRAGTETRYYLGDKEEHLARAGWYDGNSDIRLHAVGELEPNGFGLYDMHGNVWEWCLDAHGQYTTSPREGDGLRHEPKGDFRRVMRGGCFGFEAAGARSAIRYAHHPVHRWRDQGFRPAQGHS